MLTIQIVLINIELFLSFHFSFYLFLYFFFYFYPKMVTLMLFHVYLLSLVSFVRYRKSWYPLAS